MAKLKIKQMEGIIEAILFTMGDSVEVGKIARALEQDEATTRKVIHKLMDKYAAEDRGIRIIELDGAYQMCTKTEMYEYLIRVPRVRRGCVRGSGRVRTEPGCRRC